MKPTFFKTLLIALGINVFFLALCLIFGDLHWGAIDDYFMSAILTGAIGGDYNPHMVFVNAIYGYLLLPLYHLFPKIGWYYIGQMFGIFASFTTITYILLRKMGYAWGAVLASLFVAMFASDHYLVCQFTQTASILSAAGMLAFAHAIACDFNATNRKNLMRTLLLALGVVLLLWGSLMRWQAFLMGMPFFCIAMLFLLPQCWKRKWHVIAGLAVMFIAAFGMQHYDKNLYKVPKYAEFIKFQGPRVKIGDGNTYNHQMVYEDLEEAGLSGKDFEQITEWTFYDTEVFGVDSLQPILKIISNYEEPTNIFELPYKTKKAIEYSIRFPITIAWILFSLILFISNRKFNQKYALFSWLSFCAILGYIAYFFYIGRLVYHVQNGLWLYATTLTPLFWRNFFPKTPRIAIEILICIVTLNIVFYISEADLIRDPTSGKIRKSLTLSKDRTDYDTLFSYISQNKTTIFLTSIKSYMLFSQHMSPPYLAEKKNAYKQIVSFGYWTPYLPEITKDLKKYRITNPLKQVIDSNVIVVDNGDLQDYLQRHYYDSVSVDTIKNFGDINFFKYRLVTRDKQTLEYAK